MPEWADLLYGIATSLIVGSFVLGMLAGTALSCFVVGLAAFSISLEEWQRR